MSSAESKKGENQEFVARLIEACGTAEPARIKRLLNISYQAAKNYLAGRYPSTEVLITIAATTGCSIHWLLTGEGKKFADPSRPEDTPLSPGHADAFVRKICVEVINERFGSQEQQPKVVVLPSDSLREEKESPRPTFSERS